MKVRTMTALGATAMLALAGFAGPAVAEPPPNGSVGNAITKSNPKGQSNGDNNKGWRCDDNPGVGNGNPAHPSNCEE